MKPLARSPGACGCSRHDGARYADGAACSFALVPALSAVARACVLALILEGILSLIAFRCAHALRLIAAHATITAHALIAALQLPAPVRLPPLCSHHPRVSLRLCVRRLAPRAVMVTPLSPCAARLVDRASGRARPRRRSLSPLLRPSSSPPVMRFANAAPAVRLLLCWPLCLLLCWLLCRHSPAHASLRRHGI